MSATRTEPRRPPPPFELTILTGFLGAGKTTLLNRLLRDPALADTLVLINEFGDIGLDHLLVERVEGDTLLLTSGCLCCSLRGDLVTALEDALKARDNGRSAPFTRVIIETTGLADPAPILHTVMSHPYLRLRFRLRSVATLVDAVNGAAVLDAHRDAERQVALADRLILTKTDLVPADAVEGTAALRARLHVLNPAAPVAIVGDVDAAFVLGGASYDPSARSEDAANWLRAETDQADGSRAVHDGHAPDGHAHHGQAHHGQAHHGHAHDHADHAAGRHHGTSIRSVSIRSRGPVTPESVSLFSELLSSAYGDKLLRLKGIVALADDPERPLLLHGVGHMMHPPVRLERWPDRDHDTRLVVIIQDLAPRVVEDLWRAAAGEPRVDTADLATRVANPLVGARTGLLG